jgi:hypothetical protein
MEPWFRDLEDQGLERLSEKVKDSLGIQRVNRDTLGIWSRLAGLNLGRDFDEIYTNQPTVAARRRIMSISPNDQTRCFINGQFHFMPFGHFEEIDGHMRFLDSYQNVTYAEIKFNNDTRSLELANYIDTKGTISGLTIFDGFDFLVENLWSCRVQNSFADKISIESRKRIKRIKINWSILNVKKTVLLSVLQCVDRELCAKPFVAMFKEKFPNATEFDIDASTIGYKDRELMDNEIKLTAMFLNLISEAGAKKIRLTTTEVVIGPASSINNFVAGPLALGSLDSLIIQNSSHGVADLPRLLAATSNVRKVSISGMRFKGTPGEMAKVSRSNLSEISITDCWKDYRDNVQPINLTLDQQKFPKLKKVTLGPECAQAINLANFLPLQAVLRKLAPNELIRVVEESVNKLPPAR